MIFIGMDVHVRNSFFHATDDEGAPARSRAAGEHAGRVGRFFAEI